MKLLHDLVGGTVIAWVWGQAYGRNGRAIDPAEGRWNAPRAHLYEIHRNPGPTTPVFAPDIFSVEAVRSRDIRTVWNPWPRRLVQFLPLCHNVRTRSRNPRIEMCHTYNRNGIEYCQFCMAETIRRGINPTFEDELRANDPWFVQVPRANRGFTLDPVSGR